MVRHKTRWLLVKVEPASEIRSASKRRKSDKSKDSSMIFPSQKEFLWRLRRTLSWCFGMVGESAAMSMQIKFCDAHSKLFLIRGLRDHCGMIRSALTFMLTRKQMLSLGGREDAAKTEWICSVMSVHGSTRTAKIGALHLLRSIYQQKIISLRRELEGAQVTQKAIEKEEGTLCQELQERLITIQAIE